jgi:dephospho-CoA kinase
VVPFIGLTGGIGAGKSEALQALQRLGAAVLSTDAVVHVLYATDDVKQEVAGRFGDHILKNGDVDRARLAEVAFATPEDRAWLEGVLWPRVAARMIQWRSDLERQTPPPRAAVVEVPLLFEAGMESAFDATISITAPEQIRSERAQARGHAAVDERTARQLTQQEKAARATESVINDGTIEQLQEKLSAVLEKLVAA